MKKRSVRHALNAEYENLYHPQGEQPAGKKQFLPRKLHNPLISIVMTIYNEAHCVEQAIDTLLAQSYKHIELILVDNGSADKTFEVMSRYTKGKKKDSRVRLVRLLKNAQPGGGRNAGAKVAKGDILIFIDADMVFDKDYVKNLTKDVIAGKTIGTFHDSELVKNTQNLWARSLCVNRMEVVPQRSGVFRAILREHFLAVGGFDNTKGYFDDDLSVIGESWRAHATCYHNNPEKLGEIYKHSAWVGKSMMQTPAFRPKVMVGLILSWVFLLAVITLALLQQWLAVEWLIGIALVAVVIFIYAKTLPRVFKEKRIEYLVSVPIVWLVRLFGYYLGAAKQLRH